jgi:hypothetical protein
VVARHGREGRLELGQPSLEVAHVRQLGQLDAAPGHRERRLQGLHVGDRLLRLLEPALHLQQRARDPARHHEVLRDVVPQGQLAGAQHVGPRLVQQAERGPVAGARAERGRRRGVRPGGPSQLQHLVVQREPAVHELGPQQR